MVSISRKIREGETPPVPVEKIDNRLTPKSILININPQLARPNKFYVSKKQYNPDELLPIWKKDLSLTP